MRTRIVYDDNGRPQLVLCKWGETSEEPLTRRVTPTASSNLESDLDSHSDSDSVSDRGDGSLLPGDDGIVGVSGSPPLFVDKNQFVDMANPRQVQAALDGGGHLPAAQASDFSSKDGWLAPTKLSETSSEYAQLWWDLFDLFKNFKELYDQRALAIFPLMLREGAMTWYIGQPTPTKPTTRCCRLRHFPQEIN